MIVVEISVGEYGERVTCPEGPLEGRLFPEYEVGERIARALGGTSRPFLTLAHALQVCRDNIGKTHGVYKERLATLTEAAREYVDVCDALDDKNETNA